MRSRPVNISCARGYSAFASTCRVPVPSWSRDGMAGRAVVERGQDDHVHFRFQRLDQFDDHQRIEPDRQMFAVVFEHTQGQDDRPVCVNRGPDLVGEHHLKAHVVSLRGVSQVAVSARSRSL